MLLFCGIRVSSSLKSRELLLNTNISLLKIVILKALDVPFAVRKGVCSAGIAGSDTIQEYKSCLFCSVGFASSVCWFSLACLPTIKTNSKQLRLATKYTKMVSSFQGNQLCHSFIKLNGSIEVAPRIGLSDLVADIVSTGKTLEAHNLLEIKKISTITPNFICNDVALCSDARFIKIMILLLKYISSFLRVLYKH